MSQRHPFSVETYEKLTEFGILDENDRVELIRGAITEKESVSAKHLGSVIRLNRIMSMYYDERAIVSVHDPIRLADSVPEPDVALVKPREDFYASGKPRPADVLLVIEVADISIEYDRDVKRPLYAENAIPEYWIVNLIDRCLEVHRQPRPDGTYGDVQTLRRGQTVEVAALPGIVLRVDDML